MRFWLLTFLSVIGLGAITCAEEKPLTLEEIIAHHTEAMGGRDAIERRQTIQVSLHIKDPDFEIDGIYYGARPQIKEIKVNPPLDPAMFTKI